MKVRRRVGSRRFGDPRHLIDRENPFLLHGAAIVDRPL
jgi:hypothetical protein